MTSVSVSAKFQAASDPTRQFSEPSSFEKLICLLRGRDNVARFSQTVKRIFLNRNELLLIWNFLISRSVEKHYQLVQILQTIILNLKQNSILAELPLSGFLPVLSLVSCFRAFQT